MITFNSVISMGLNTEPPGIMMASFSPFDFRPDSVFLLTHDFSKPPGECPGSAGIGQSPIFLSDYS
ncbi:MAG TPA: hypothetical protein P5318_10000, partial [Candidatus Hydrogenedentes bacterium]|nr:hypothetical protein [Candidatus Hydrogenedentota bacterium]HRT66386.1 hypothetical protein [Candidatus Hydrogenedentota bacterium]